MISIQNVKFSYRSGFWLKPATVLKGVTFEVPSKSVFVLMGPNGAGKTTLIHLVAGLRRPSDGSIRVQGLDPAEPPTRAHMGFVPERPYFYDFLTGEKLLRFFGGLAKMPVDVLNRRIEEVLELTRMTHARKRELRGYSKGMLQRIGIAQAILHDPQVLVFDEPFSGLDPAGQKMLMQIVSDLKNAGKTVFMTSHWLQPLNEFCTHYAAIQKGEIAEQGSMKDRSSKDFERFFMELE